ncbi:MAG: FAD-binding protein, partial [Gemmatimonadaceae bacterium]
MLTARYEGPDVRRDLPPLGVRLSPDSSDVADFLHDESKLGASHIASLAVPESVDELRAVMRWHALAGNRVAFSASRTGVTGGGVPEDGAHVVSVAALRGVKSVDADADTPTITVFAGTWLAEMNLWLSEH